jgi:hypothetical protein
MRASVAALVTSLAGDRPAAVVERLEKTDAATTILLMERLTRALPAVALDAALSLKARPVPAVQVAALGAFAASPYTAVLGRTVVAMLASPFDEVRHAAIEYLASCGDPRAYEALAKHALARAGQGLTADEAEHLGEALARQDAATALALFAGWLQPPSLLHRMVEGPSQRMLHRLAVAGLARVPGEEAEKHLRAFLERSTGDLHQLCLAALVQRRREQVARSGGRRAG